MSRLRALVLLALVLPTLPLAAQTARPKVRALTAFVRIDPRHFESQVADTLTMLRDAKRGFEQHGYEVQTIRMTTQPFPEM